MGCLRNRHPRQYSRLHINCKLGTVIHLAYLYLQGTIAVTASTMMDLFLRQCTTRFDLLMNYLYNLLYNWVKHFFSKLVTIAKLVNTTESDLSQVYLDSQSLFALKPFFSFGFRPGIVKCSLLVPSNSLLMSSKSFIALSSIWSRSRR
jgi:hypothetical protein